MTDALLPTLLSTAFLYCLIVLLVAGFAHGVFGIGFAMIATPLLALTLDYRSAIFLAAVPLLFISIYFLVLRRRFVLDEPLAKLMTPGIILGSLVGVWLQGAMPQSVALVLLAVLLACSAALPALLQRWKSTEQREHSDASPKTFGALAGVTEAALNVGAPFIVLYGGLAGLNRARQMLALNLCFAVGKSIQVLLLTVAMPIPVSGMQITSAVGVSLVGYLGGNHLAGKYSEQTFRLFLNIFLYCMAFALIMRVAFVA